MEPAIMLSSLVIEPLLLLMEFAVSVTRNYLSAKVGILLAVLVVTLVFLQMPLHAYFRRKWRKNTGTETTVQKGTGKDFLLGLPILLEIPILSALYLLMTDQELFSVALGPIWNLGLPDSLLVVGGVTVHILPVMAAFLFLGAGLIGARRVPWAGKILFPVIAVTACVFLFHAAASISLCWGLSSLILVLLNLRPIPSGNRKRILRNSSFLKKKANPVSLLLSAGLFTILTGILIPSSVLVSSPSEFMESSASMNPLWYVLIAFLTAAGVSFLWFGALYQLSSRRTKKVLEVIAWVICGVMLVNYVFFRKNLGIITSNLQYEVLPEFTMQQRVVNFLILAAVGIVLAFVMIREDLLIRVVSIMLIIGLGGMSVRNLWITAGTIRNTVDQMEKNEENSFHIPLSRTGRNVIVLMLDRAIGVFMPSILYEKTELAMQYSGFVFYPNTLSHGAFTNFGTPGLFGGYEYTPAEMNKRDQEPLVDKHNEALKVMPALFSENGFKVTVCNPSYAGYNTKPDLTIFDDIKNTSAYVTSGVYASVLSEQAQEETGIRNYFCYALCETAPLLVYSCMYNFGNYNQLTQSHSTQIQKDKSVATGISSSFLRDYTVLQKLGDLTQIKEEAENTFLMMANTITHNPALLSEPDYLPAGTVNNEAYDREHEDRFTNVEIPLQVISAQQMTHYHSLMAGILKIGEWLDYLKENGIYDNTRIIIVSDHGRRLRQPGLSLETGEDLFYYNPLLLVKDFDSKGEIRTDYSFMTNADVPTLATNGIIDHPVNPYTGLEINGNKNKESLQLVTTSHEWDLKNNNGNVFLPAKWFSVHDNLFDISNWEYIGEK